MENTEYIRKRDAIDMCGGYTELAYAMAGIESADVVLVMHGKWIKQGKQMIINLENAREQYAALGYPHRNEYRLQCSVCGKITMVDGGIVYEYCPHCGADMREKEKL